MIFCLDLPHLFTPGRIESIDVCSRVAEVGREVAIHLADADGAPDAGAGVEDPMNTACLCVEGVNVACPASHKYTPAPHHGLSAGRDRARKTKCPFQLQS